MGVVTTGSLVVLDDVVDEDGRKNPSYCPSSLTVVEVLELGRAVFSSPGKNTLAGSSSEQPPSRAAHNTADKTAHIFFPIALTPAEYDLAYFPASGGEIRPKDFLYYYTSFLRDCQVKI